LNGTIKNYKLEVEYDGTDFYGWQFQIDKRTASGVLEQALRTIAQDHLNLKIVAAGRTDKGVHGEAQVVSVEAIIDIPVDKIARIVNGLLPKDIRVKNVEIVDKEFSARFSAKAREYTYLLSTSKFFALNLRRYLGSVDNSLSLNVKAMREAAKTLIGERYLKSFCSSGSEEKIYFRNIHHIKISSEEYKWLHGEKCEVVKFEIKANAFLYRMVRNIIRALVDVGIGKISVEEFIEITNSGNRKLVGKPMPAEGLYLSKVYY